MAHGPRAKYFPIRPFHLVNKYILFSIFCRPPLPLQERKKKQLRKIKVICSNGVNPFQVKQTKRQTDPYSKKKQQHSDRKKSNEIKI